MTARSRDSATRHVPGVKVGHCLAGDADVVEDEIHDRRTAGLGHRDVIQAQPFLEDFAGRAAQAARGHAADVAPVRPKHDEERGAIAVVLGDEHRIDDGDIVQVGAAGVRVVVQLSLIHI